MEKISVSSRFNVFPAGLRVLVVDDDLTWLKILEKMLIKCHYEVTTSCLATEALNILRERKNKFDIVISDVNMPDMDGFTLLELVGLEMDLPVIMMSVDGETSRVMKGVQHGACDYLLKPVRMKELRIIWQHVFRKKMNEIKEIEINEDAHKIRNYLNEFDSSYLATGSDLSSRKKRKDIKNQEHDDYEFMDSSSSKKSRVVWSVDLHQKFVQAVNQSGSEKVGPKKILDLMNVPWLTRENVASHLQKYRMCLDRLKKQNEPKNSFCVPKQPDLKNPPSGFGYQSPISVNGDNSTTCSFANKIVMEDMSPKVLEDLCIGPFSARTEVSAGNIAHPRKASNSSRMSLTDSFESLHQDINYTSFRANFLEQISWCSTEIPTLQFSELLEEEQEQYLYTNQPLPVNKSAPFMISATSNEETVSGVLPKLRPPFEHFGNICPTECKDNSVSSDISTQASGDMCTRLSSIKTSSFHQNLFGTLESYQQNFMKRSDSTSASSEEDQQLWSLQDYDYFGPVELSNRGILNDPENITELSSHLYDKNVR